ncbi:MAG: 3-methyl-2-oxobutanoate hydroxymethyltransferase [bacterium]
MKNKQLTIADIQQLKQKGQPITMMTAYDATQAMVLDRSGVDCILVGDSLGMVVQGQRSTIPVSVSDIVYHTNCVTSTTNSAFVIADMPFLSYSNAKLALKSARRLMSEGHAHMVKLEGAGKTLKCIKKLSESGVPVCAHLGLEPQSVHKEGGYKVKGRGEQADEVLKQARAVEKAGAMMLVLECVPALLAEKISKELSIPVIGIGAGNQCDGQVLVFYDAIGMYTTRPAKFCKNFMLGHDSVEQAIKSYVKEVVAREFPSPRHSFE